MVQEGQHQEACAKLLVALERLGALERRAEQNYMRIERIEEHARDQGEKVDHLPLLVEQRFAQFAKEVQAQVQEIREEVTGQIRGVREEIGGRLWALTVLGLTTLLSVVAGLLYIVLNHAIK